jgi:hypothetical protein
MAQPYSMDACNISLRGVYVKRDENIPVAYIVISYLYPIVHLWVN